MAILVGAGGKLIQLVFALLVEVELIIVGIAHSLVESVLEPLDEIPVGQILVIQKAVGLWVQIVRNRIAQVVIALLLVALGQKDPLRLSVVALAGVRVKNVLHVQEEVRGAEVVGRVQVCVHYLGQRGAQTEVHVVEDVLVVLAHKVVALVVLVVSVESIHSQQGGKAEDHAQLSVGLVRQTQVVALIWTQLFETHSWGEARNPDESVRVVQVVAWELVVAEQVVERGLVSVVGGEKVSELHDLKGSAVREHFPQFLAEERLPHELARHYHKVSIVVFLYLFRHLVCMTEVVYEIRVRFWLRLPSAVVLVHNYAEVPPVQNYKV